MPFRCLNATGDVSALKLSDLDWEALESENRALRHLRMPCCPAQVILRRSPRGLKHFAHKSRGTCTTAPETEEHLILKRLAVEAAEGAGWSCDTEVQGSTPSGEAWTADVLACKGNNAVAVEIQWSKQTPEETLDRQERYRRSGVRGLWLVRRPGFPETEDLPAVCICGDKSSGFEAKISSGQVMPMDEFLDAAFAKRFRFGVPIGASATVTVHSGVIDCWRSQCQAKTRIVTFIDVVSGPHSFQFTINRLSQFPDLLKSVLARLPPSQNVGAIKARFSRTVGGSYMSNGCYRCDALIGEFFEHDAWDSDPRVLVEFDVTISDQWQIALSSHEFEGTLCWGVYPDEDRGQTSSPA